MSLPLRNGGMVIFLSFIAAMAAQIIPLPDFLEQFRPDWPILVLIYWCMALPDRVGVGTAWGVGLVVDVLRGALLGQHAMTMAIVAFLTLNLHQRIRVFPLWQQAITVLILLFFQSVLILWISGAVGKTPGLGVYMLPAAMSALLWPVVFVIMRKVRRYYQVN